MRTIFILFLTIIMTFQFYSYSNENDWTWSYIKKIGENECKNSINKKSLIFSKNKIHNFTQLIICWNSYRPKKGFFSFYVQTKDSVTKKWSNWIKMMDWGNGIKKSYQTILDKGISCHYVRLEIPKGKFSDGFKLKIESNDEASLSNLKMINVCISDFSKFSIESNEKEILRLDSIKIYGVPKKSQMVVNHEDNKKICSPTSTSMLVSYLTKRKIDPINFALNVFDDGLEAYGSWPFNVSYAFEVSPKYFFRVIRLNSFLDLYSYLSKKLPVVVSVRGKLDGAPQEYNSGHLILVIGWDKKSKSVIVHDPAFDQDRKVEHKYKLQTFLSAWERSHRLAYVVETK